MYYKIKISIAQFTIVIKKYYFLKHVHVKDMQTKLTTGLERLCIMCAGYLCCFSQRGERGISI